MNSKTSTEILKFGWGQGTFDIENFGSPLTTTSFSLCVYNDAELITSALVHPQVGWKEKYRSGLLIGYKHKLRQTSPPLKEKLSMRSGLGSARIDFSTKRLSTARLPIETQDDGFATVQLIVGEGPACMEAVFPRQSIFRNDSKKFLAFFIN